MPEFLLTLIMLPIMGAVFLLPGVLLALVIGAQRLLLPSAVILGYGWLLSWSILARATDFSTGLLAGVFLTATLGLLIFVIIRRAYLLFEWRRCLVPISTLLLPVLVYLLMVGPYNELPGDVYQHLTYLSNEYASYMDGALGRPVDSVFLFDKSLRHWYVINAGVASAVGVPPHEFMAAMGTYHVLTLIAVIAVVALHQVSELRWRREAQWAAVIAAVLFFVLHFGLGIFSYVRYYSIAPTVGAYAIYLSGIVLYIDYLRGYQGTRAIVLVALAGFLAALIHLQEAMYLGLMIGMSTLVVAWDSRTQLLNRSARRVLTLGLGVAIFGAMVVAYFFLVRSPRLPIVPMQVPLSEFIPFVRNLYVPNPVGQIFQVITVWGVLVIALAVYWRADLKSATLLRAGLWSLPLIVFNPIYTHFFLRLAHPEVLWRVSLILPLAMLGGFVIVRCLYPVRPLGIALAVAVVLALAPFDFRYLVNPYSKWHMLQPVPEENTWRHWEDLSQFLAAWAASEVIITDPLTGYVIDATTYQHHTVDRWKFMAYGGYLLGDEVLSLQSFERYDGMLLIVNDRVGGWSETGALGRHWRPDQLDPTRHYSSAFRTLLAENTGAFLPLWSQDNVTVYRVDID